MSNILAKSFIWYFFDVTKEILKGWRNFLVFNLNYFSLVLLLRTLFSPWRRYHYSYGKGFSPKRYINVFVFNMMSRLIGSLFRIGLIILGVLVEVFIVIAGIILTFGWILLPFILLFGLIFGFRLIVY